MKRPVCYDVTRLLTRVLNATPNGIDRVDFALAQHFLSDAPSEAFGATATGIGARLLSGVAAKDAVDGIARHWGETAVDLAVDPVYQRILTFLTGGDANPKAAQPRRPFRVSLADVSGTARWVRRYGLPMTRTPRAHLPQRSVYLNASQFPLWVAGSFEWLEQRPDVRAAFFIHDLLPIFLPEYFRKAEFERHHKRLRNFARFGAAAIVTTRSVASGLEDHLATLGRKDCPIFVAPTPVAPIFSAERVVEPALSGRPFFVFCSTIEPRKNHQMILAVWRALANRLGRDTPKLVLVGSRGWHYRSIIDLIERSPPLKDHVLEIAGLSTPGLKRLLDNAQALLMPSFGEGYGLPVHEALAAGVPVVASDIPAFREIEAEGLLLLSPLNGDAWLETVAAMSQVARPPISSTPTSIAGWSGYFGLLETFLDAL